MNRFRMPAVALVLFVLSAATAHAQHACDPPPVPVPGYCSRDDGIILLDWTPSGSTDRISGAWAAFVILLVFWIVRNLPLEIFKLPTE